MKRITHKCGCGAEATWVDESDRNIYSQNENAIRDWLKDHADCRQAKRESSDLKLSGTEFCDSCRDLCLRDELRIVYQDSTGIETLNCERCMQDRKINPKLSPDPDECAKRRADREVEEGLAFWTKEEARLYANEKVFKIRGFTHFYSCSVGGKEHWHVETLPLGSVISRHPVFPGIESVSVEKMEVEIEAAPYNGENPPTPITRARHALKLYGTCFSEAQNEELAGIIAQEIQDAVYGEHLKAYDLIMKFQWKHDPDSEMFKAFEDLLNTYAPRNDDRQSHPASLFTPR